MGKKHKRHEKEHEQVQDVTYTGYISEPLEERGWFVDIQMSCLTVAVLLGLYIRTLHPSVAGGDSGELIVSAHEWGVTHPPGYPLFTITAKLAMLCLPWGSAAWKVNALNAFYSAGAGGMLQLTTLRLTGSQGSGLLAVALFSLSRLTWTWSVCAEVFGLNNLMVATLMFVAVLFDMAQTVRSIRKITYFGAFWSGLALTNQHTVIIYVAFISIWVLLRLKKMHLLNWQVLAKITLCFLLGLVPYIYLPLSSYINIARWTWGDQQTVSGFLSHLLRSEYGTFDLGKDGSGLGFVHGLRTYLEHSYSNLCEIGPFLALIGTLTVLNRKEKGEGSLFVFVMMLAGYSSFFAWRANLDISQPLFAGVVERFWMQSDMVMTLLACIGYKQSILWVTRKVLGPTKESLSLVFAMIGAVSVLALQFRNFAACNFSNNLVVHDFARTILSQFPKDAIVFTRGDLPTNSLRYFHLCEEMRPDLELLDVEMMSYEWSTKLWKYYPRLKFPGDFWHLKTQRTSDGRKSFNFKSLLDANYKHALMYVCIGMQDKDPSWQERYMLLPFGVCHKIDDASDFVPEEWANKTSTYSDTWNYRWDSFSDTSWEKVANDEMWHAKISTAFFMYDQAEKSKDSAIKSRLLQTSYNLYFDAIKKNQKPSKMKHEEFFPLFWHKNFALVLERLLHEEHDLPKAQLCKQSMSHFQRYLSANRKDDDADTIVNAINSLRQRLPTYEQFDNAMHQVKNITKRYV